MVIVLILVVLWGVVLIPTVLRKLQSKGSHQSIDSFHRSLHLLESSGPKIVQPAYRLASGDSMAVPVVARPAAIDVTPRPQLVLLRPPGQEEETTLSDYFDDYADADDDGYFGDDDRAFSLGISRPSESYGRRMAARRRRSIVLGLTGAAFVTALAGVFLSFFFVLTALSVIGLVGYVGLMSYVVVTSGATTDQRYVHERHVAHATSWDDEPVWDEEDLSEFASPEQVGDGWWDEPRRAVGR